MKSLKVAITVTSLATLLARLFSVSCPADRAEMHKVKLPRFDPVMAQASQS